LNVSGGGGIADVEQKLRRFWLGAIDAQGFEEFVEEGTCKETPLGSAAAKFFFRNFAKAFKFVDDGADLGDLFLIGKTIGQLQGDFGDGGAELFISIGIHLGHAHSDTFDGEGEESFGMEPVPTLAGRVIWGAGSDLPKIHRKALLQNGYRHCREMRESDGEREADYPNTGVENATRVWQPMD
jgi:hypothetical protein